MLISLMGNIEQWQGAWKGGGGDCNLNCMAELALIKEITFVQNPERGQDSKMYRCLGQGRRGKNQSKASEVGTCLACGGKGGLGG